MFCEAYFVLMTRYLVKTLSPYHLSIQINLTTNVISLFERPILRYCDFDILC